jgi:hypothetical protein
MLKKSIIFGVVLMLSVFIFVIPAETAEGKWKKVGDSLVWVNQFPTSGEGDFQKVDEEEEQTNFYIMVTASKMNRYNMGSLSLMAHVDWDLLAFTYSNRTDETNVDLNGPVIYIQFGYRDKYETRYYMQGQYILSYKP